MSFRNLTPWCRRYTQFGICHRVKSNTTPGVHYIVTIRMKPEIGWNCQCKHMELQKEKQRMFPEFQMTPCSHIRKEIAEWVNRGMAARCHALGRLKAKTSDIADEGVRIIASQPRMPFHELYGDRKSKVAVAMEFGLVQEDKNWEMSDAVNAFRWRLTDAGDQRWNELRQEQGLKDLGALARVQERFGKPDGMRIAPSLTNPINEL